MSQPPLRDSYEGLYARAERQLRSGDVEGAIAILRRLVDRLRGLSEAVLRRRPDLGALHQDARLNLARILAAEGRYAEAIEAEEILLETHPEETTFWRRDLAVLRAAKGEVDVGLRELRELAEEAPDEPGGWLVLGGENRLAGRLADSEAALERALEAGEGGDDEPLADIQFQRFLLYREMKQLDDAIAAWEEAVAMNPEVGESVREVYTMLTKAGRYSDALRYVDRDENDLQAGFQRGLIASLTGKALEAREQWRQVASLEPDEYEYGHDAWVEAVLRLGDPDPALAWLQESLASHGTPRLLVLSGIGWAMRKDPEMASMLFQQAINAMRRERPPKQKLPSDDWRLLDSLVSEEKDKSTLKAYFGVVETLWS
jgi:tetratricopeptide (TPR) repeat protein